MKKIILGVVGIACIGIGVGLYLWNKPHRNVADESAIYSFQDTDLTRLFETHPDSANSVLLDQVIEVSGEVQSIDGDSTVLVILSGVVASLNNDVETPQAGQQIILKGRFTNYDDLFMEVRLDQSTWKPKNQKQ